MREGGKNPPITCQFLLTLTFKQVKSSPMILRALGNNWPLFFGIVLVMIGNGLQGTLLGVRASVEGFDTVIIGILMSCYFLGFLGGFNYVPGFIRRVGHIRVFAALASLASTAVLLHGVFVNEIVWALGRFATGFCYAGLYIVMESWLNQAATNKNRGSILSLYMLSSYGGLILGQFMLNITSPEKIELFILTSVIVSLALLPISLSSRKAPDMEDAEVISFRYLFKMSPLGITGMFLNGICGGVIFGLGPVFGAEIGLSVPQISFFMASFLAGGIVFPIIIGWISDHINRRLVIIMNAAILSCLGLGAYMMSSTSFEFLLLLTFLLGGLNFSAYGLSLAHTNDYLKPSQMLSASSALILLNGMGACLGPFIVAAAMRNFGTGSFFMAFCIIYGALFFFGLYRMSRREALSTDEQGDYVILPESASPVAAFITEDE